jgi:hypothetical protein
MIYPFIPTGWPQNYHCYNITVDYDQTTQHFYFSVEVKMYENENEYTSMIALSTKKITEDNLNGFLGIWESIGFFCLPNNHLRNPIFCVNEKRWYFAEILINSINQNKTILYAYGDENILDFLIDEEIKFEEITSDDSIIAIHSQSEMNASILYTKNNNLLIRQTKDGGETWGNENQINDIDGTVISEYRNGDIYDNYVVWTDNRNGNHDIYFDIINSENRFSNLEIIEISAGLGILASVENNGTDAVENVNWTVNLINGFILGTRNFQGTIPSISQGKISTISIPPVFGFGKIEIEITVFSEETWVTGDIIKASGFLIGPYIILN